MREVIFLLALASANSGVSLRIVEPMLPRLAQDFDLSIPATASVITSYALAAAIADTSLFFGAYSFLGPFLNLKFGITWSLGQAMGVAAMGVAVEIAGYAPAIIGFALGFFALGLWMRYNLHRLS